MILDSTKKKWTSKTEGSNKCIEKVDGNPVSLGERERNVDLTNMNIKKATQGNTRLFPTHSDYMKHLLHHFLTNQCITWGCNGRIEQTSQPFLLLLFPQVPEATDNSATHEEISPQCTFLSLQVSDAYSLSKYYRLSIRHIWVIWT